MEHLNWREATQARNARWPTRPDLGHAVHNTRSKREWAARDRRTLRRKICRFAYYDWIAHYGRRTPKKLAVVDLATGRSFSYEQFDNRISRLAAHLRDRLGIKRGDRVAVLAMNTSDTLEVQFACGRLGAVFVPSTSASRCRSFNTSSATRRLT